jgi:hypothetical protein
MLPLSLSWDHRVIDGARRRASTPTWADPGGLPPRTSLRTPEHLRSSYDNRSGGEESRADRHRSRHPGDLRRHALSHRFEDNTKIFRRGPAGPSYIGMAGTVAHFPVLRKAMGSMPREILRLGSKDECSTPSPSCTRT